MPERKRHRSTKKIKSLQTRKLTASQAKGVRGGGHKHIGGVKYEDITIDCGTGMSKTTS